METLPVRWAQGLSRVVTRFPKGTIAFFLVLGLAGAAFVPGLRLYLSFYQLIPPDYVEGDELTKDYYEWYTRLNRDFGGDNWDFYVVRAQNVTDVRVVREMNAVSEAVKSEFGYVTGTLSLAELVKIVNYLVTGQYAFPPEGQAGDVQIRQSIDFLLSQPQYRNQIIGNLVSQDFQTAILIVILEQGRPLEDYRWMARDLKQFGFEIDGGNPYGEASQMYPINVDTIYLKLDQVTFAEGTWWVLLAFGAVLVVSLWLFRSPVFTLITILNLTVVVAATLAALYFTGGYLNLLTMLLIAMIFGVGDDYTTYALTIYRNERALGHPLRHAILSAQEELASALLIAVLVTLSGFASLWLTGFPAIMIFGTMAATGVLLSYLGALTLVPACLWLYFRAVDRRKARGEATPGHDRLLRRAAQTQSEGTKLTSFALRHKGVLAAAFALVGVALLSPFAWGDGVATWNGSYSRIFDQDSYEMETYNNVARWMGIPIEAVVFVRGDPTDPEFLRMVDRLDKATGTYVGDPNGIHRWVKADSLADVVRDNYVRFAATERGLDPNNPGALVPVLRGVDTTNDGLPDDAAFLRRMYEWMWDDPATTVLMGRVVARDYSVTLVRIGINVETGDGITPVENGRRAVRDLEEVVRGVQGEYTHVAPREAYAVTGLAVVLLAVNKSIEFGNQWTTIIMIAVIFGLVTLYYRRPVHTALIMLPLLFGVGVQYFLMSLLHYEMTYVAVIVTSVDMGLGIDLGVHTYANFRKSLRAGRAPRAAILESTGAVNLAMIAALFTDMSAFLLIPWSDITWAAQTARILLGSVAAILIAAVFLLPLLFYWDARRNPRAYGARLPPAPDQPG